MPAHLCEIPYMMKNSLKITDFFVSDVKQECDISFTEIKIFQVSFNHDFHDFAEILFVFLNKIEVFHSYLPRFKILVSCPDLLCSTSQQTITFFWQDFWPLFLLIWKKSRIFFYNFMADTHLIVSSCFRLKNFEEVNE